MFGRNTAHPQDIFSLLGGVGGVGGVGDVSGAHSLPRGGGSPLLCFCLFNAFFLF